MTSLSETDKDAVKRACAGVGINTKGDLLMLPVNHVKGKKRQKRTIALSPYRLLSIKNAKTVTKNLHYFDLREVICDTDVEVTFNFAIKKSKVKISMVFQTPDVPLLVRFFLEHYTRITNGFTSDKRCSLRVQEKYLEELKNKCIDFNPASGFVETYRGWCSYFGKPVCRELLNFVNLLSSQNRTDFDMREFPIMSVKTELSMTLARPPLFMSLIHNTYFREIICANVPLTKDDMLLFAKILCHNRTVEKLVLSGVSQNNDWTQAFGEALASNTLNRLQVLDLSHNKLGNKGIQRICFPGLMNFFHTLTALNLANCNIKPLGLHSLICCLMKHMSFSASLEELDLSQNCFDMESSLAMQTWLSTIKEFGRLRVLKVSACKVDLPSVLQPLRALPIREFDISDNKIEEVTCKALCSFLELSHTLEMLNITKCGLVGSMGERVLVSIATNEKLSRVKLLMGDNGMGETEAEGLTSGLLINRRLSCLDLSLNNFKEPGMIGILQGLVLSQTTVLERLVLDDALAGMNTLAGDHISSALISLLSTLTCLRSLSVAGGLGKVAIPFLASGFRNAPNLQHLNVSNNRLGDLGAAALAEVLRVNKTLLSVEADGNDFSLAGWDLISTATQRNHILQHFGFPWRDYDRATSALRPSQRQWLQRILLDMQHSLHANRSLRPHPDAPLYVPQQTLPSGPKPSPFLRNFVSIPEMALSISLTSVIPAHLSNLEGIIFRALEPPRQVEEMLARERELQRVAEEERDSKRTADKQPVTQTKPGEDWSAEVPLSEMEQWEAEQMSKEMERMVKEIQQDILIESEVPPALPPRDDEAPEQARKPRKSTADDKQTQTLPVEHKRKEKKIRSRPKHGTHNPTHKGQD